MNLGEHVFQLVAQNRMPEALKLLRESLPSGGPLLEAVAQSGRYTDLMQRIHSGTLAEADAAQEKNKIRLAVLNLADLVDEVVAERPELAGDLPRVERQINQQHSGSGDNVGGDKIIHNG